MRAWAGLLLAVVALAGCASPDLDSGIEGTVFLGPTCPVQQDPPDPDCADRPYAAHLALVEEDGKKVKEFRSGEDGRFRVAVEPGTYRIRSADGENALPSCSAGPFTVEPDGYLHVDVACDSGIR